MAVILRICDGVFAVHSREIASSIFEHVIDPFLRGLPIPRLGIEEAVMPKNFREAVLPAEAHVDGDSEYVGVY